jgi:nitronate monooxygenase
VRGTTPLATLLQQVVAALEVPVIAAGGIATGAALAPALNAGASAVRMGTRFLATAESGAHPDYVTALLAAAADATVHTTAFGEGWPDAPIACCASPGSARPHVRTGSSPAPPTGTRAGRFVRWSTQPPTVFTTGEVAAMAMYADCGVGDIADLPTAAQIVERMMAEAVPLLPPQHAEAVLIPEPRSRRLSRLIRCLRRCPDATA